MFTKEVIRGMFTEMNGTNFIIKTNEAVGRGINGVDYTTYVGYHKWDDRSFGNRECFVKNTIKKITDTYIVVEQDTNEGYLRGITEHIIPLSGITSIVFLSGSQNENYPSSIEPNNLFNSNY